MALSRVFSLDDPSACQAVFPSADVKLFPTAKGNFHAEIAQVGMNRIWMHRIHISLPEINTVAVKPGRRSIGFLTECNSSSLLDCGLEVRPGDMVINRSDVVHQRSDADFHYGTVSLPSDDLAAAAEAIIGRGPAGDTSQVHCSPAFCVDASIVGPAQAHRAARSPNPGHSRTPGSDPGARE